MSAANLTAIMDGLAAHAVAWGGVPNVYAYPVEAVTVPCLVVGYPTEWEVGTTMQRGGDHLVLPVWVLVGQSFTEDCRDALSALVAGGSDLADALESGGTWGDVDSIDAEIASVPYNAVAYLGLKLTVDVRT